MKSYFSNENFERFLRQNADGLRMRPSDRVWKNISGQLNRKRRWGWLASGFFLLLAVTTGYMIHETPSGSGTAQKASAGKQQPSSKTNYNQPLPSESKSMAVLSLNPASGSDIRPAIRQQSENIVADEEFAVTGDDFTPTVIDNDPLEENRYIPADPEISLLSGLPYSRESVINSFRPRNRKPVEWQWFITPTISYRKLGENRSYLHQQQWMSAPAPPYDVNNVVTHKPEIGFQMGLLAKYPLTRAVKLFSGLQFNVARYDIKAYSSPTAVATIMLNGTNSADSITSTTSYNNFNGYRSNWLENIYLQISAPVGAELRIRGDEKVAFGFAGSVQPTYMIRERAYVISTDYKNYAQVPDLVRRWNVNTQMEAFVSYRSANVKWQVGPQMRYQLLSSYISEYPVKENLFDFGLKVGVSRNK